MTHLYVPFFSLQQQVLTLHDKIMTTLQSVVDSQQFIGGNFIAAFEEKLSRYLNNHLVIANNSGTDALWLALKALDIKAEDIVLTTPFSFIASSSEILDHKAHAVFIDIDPITYNINPILLEQWLKTQTHQIDGITIHTATGKPVRGIVTVDLFGQLADYTKIQRIAQEWNLWIIEDACQAIGATDNGRHAGTFGTVGTFSFYPTKNLGAFGDGGACITSDKGLAEHILRLRNHGRASHYAYEELGINSRLDAMQAAVLSLKLDHLDAWQQRRQAIAAHYSTMLQGHDIITLPQEVYGTHVYHQYCIQLPDEDFSGKSARDYTIDFCNEQSIGTRVFYPETLDTIPFLTPPASLKTVCPIAQKMTRTILALPIWPELSDAQVEYVAATLKRLTPPAQMHKIVLPEKLNAGPA